MVNNGIPLWFRCFKGTENPEAFKTSLIIEGISFVNNLFKDKNCSLIFLADRWFPNCETMRFIDSIDATYCIRARSNFSIHIDDYEYSDLIGSLNDIEPFFSKSKYFDSVQITSNNFQTKLACIALLWLTIIGSDYSKNKNHFKNCFKIKCSKKNGNGNKRIFSLFNTGLYSFNLAFESTKYVLLKCNFMLYDI